MRRVDARRIIKASNFRGNKLNELALELSKQLTNQECKDLFLNWYERNYYNL